MGATYKQITSLSFAGIPRPGDPPAPARPPLIDIDEDTDIWGSEEQFERPVVQVRPLRLMNVDLPGDDDVRRLPLLVNDDVRVELTTSKTPSEVTHGRTDGWHEVHIQVENVQVSRTPAGDFTLDASDLLVVPAGVSHESSSDTPSTTLIVSTRRPMRVAEGYPGEEAKETRSDGIIHLRPSAASDAAEEGPSGGKHFELLANEDLLIETTFRADDQRIYHKGYGQDEVHFQLSGRRATRTSQGEYLLETGDALLIPPGVAHRNIGGLPTVRIVLYARDQLNVPAEYQNRLHQAWGG
jgi:mannose-6-phosphate isomerase-like protein (cupin superfamily)